MDNLHQLLVRTRGDLPPRSPGLDLDLITLRGRRKIRRRRWSVVAAAVAVTLAAGSLFPFVRRDSRPAPVAPVPASPVFAARLHGFSFGGFTVGASTMVTPGYEVAPLTRDGVSGPTRWAGSVEVYRAGAFDPTVFRAGTPVVVGATPGFLHVDTTTLRYGAAGNQKIAVLKKPAVAWQYADNAWAVVRSSLDGQLKTGMLVSLASHLALGPAAVVKLPFRVGYVPPGLSVAGAGRISPDFIRDTTLGRLGEMTLAPSRSWTGLTSTVQLGGVTIVEEKQQEGVPRGATSCDSWGCYRGLPGTDLYIGVTGKLPTVQLRKLIDSLTLADPSRPATWFPLVSLGPQGK
jgi:hypothetical protein